MKPWEETWTLKPHHPEIVLDEVANEVAETDDADRAMLIAAAPEMARALAAMFDDDGHTSDCTDEHGLCSLRCAGARAALRKAGVIP